MVRSRHVSLEEAEEEVFPVSDSLPIWAKHEVHEHREPCQLHMHFGVELVIVMSGALRTFNEKHDMIVGPGQVWFNAMWEPHGWEIEEAPCEVVVTVCIPRILSTLQFEGLAPVNWLQPWLVAPAGRPQTPRGHEGELLNIANGVFAAINEDRPRYGFLLRLLLMESLLVLYEKQRLPSARPSLPLSEAAPIGKAVHMVFNTQRLITAEQVAKVCGLSRSVFNRRFKVLMGIDFAKFALRHRLSGAARQIVAGTTPMKQIAGEWGFADTSHLHRVFVRHYGCTPSEYRGRQPAGAKGIGAQRGATPVKES